MFSLQYVRVFTLLVSVFSLLYQARSKTHLHKPLVAEMQKSKAKSKFYEKQREPRKRSILASIVPIPFQSVLVLSHAWTQWRFANLTVEKTSSAFIPHPMYLQSKELRAIEQAGDVHVLRLLWLGVAKGQATIEVEGLSVLISSFALFYGIAMPKEKMLSVLIRATAEHAGDFTFVEALHFLPSLNFTPPSQASMSQSLEDLKLCYGQFRWNDLFRACCSVGGSFTMPLWNLVLQAVGKCLTDEVLTEDFCVFVRFMYAQPDNDFAVSKTLPLFTSSVCNTLEETEPLTSGLSLLFFFIQMDSANLTQYIR